MQLTKKGIELSHPANNTMGGPAGAAYATKTEAETQMQDPGGPLRLPVLWGPWDAQGDRGGHRRKHCCWRKILVSVSCWNARDEQRHEIAQGRQYESILHTFVCAAICPISPYLAPIPLTWRYPHA